jgi:hypothetical protein
MKKNIMVLGLIFVFMMMFSGRVFAEPGAFSLSLAGQYIPFVTGDAGKGDGAPDYDDAFDGGLAVAVEAAYRLNPYIAVLGGIDYEQFSGDSHQGISFDDLDIVTVYVGGKIYFVVNQQGWNSYVRADVGAAHFSSVDISYAGFDGDYWDSSWEVMADAGLGLEYTFSNLGVFFEIKARYMNSPSAASEMKEFSRAESSWSLPIMLGVNFHF